MFTFGSLFSGIGGIDLGLERAGMHCKWQVENDAYATKVLAKHWPHVARYGDIRHISPLERVDLIAGGFPCQDISSAGRRAGITGERSGLWSEFYRLICELRPRYVLVENVAALTSRGIDTVLGNLAEGGYDAEWQVLSAASVGAPHLRERIFIVAYTTSGRQQECQDTERVYDQSYSSSDVSNATGNGRGWRQLQPLTRKQERETVTCENGNGQQMAHAESNGRRSWGTECQGQQGQLFSEWSSTPLAHANRSRLAFRQVFTADAGQKLATVARNCSTGTGVWATESGVRRVVNGAAYRVDRLRTLGNAVVPQVAEYVGRLIMEHDHATTLTL